MAEFFQKPAGKFTAGAFLLIAIGGASYAVYSFFGPTVASEAAKQVFVDSATGKSFPHTLTAGEVVPVTAPSGGRTGYPAELCFWTADGQPKDSPDYVLLNEAKGDRGPTFCPYCHRLVVHHNPSPRSGAKLPPTEAEYNQR